MESAPAPAESPPEQESEQNAAADAMAIDEDAPQAREEQPIVEPASETAMQVDLPQKPTADATDGGAMVVDTSMDAQEAPITLIRSTVAQPSPTAYEVSSMDGIGSGGDSVLTGPPLTSTNGVTAPSRGRALLPKEAYTILQGPYYVLRLVDALKFSGAHTASSRLL